MQFSDVAGHPTALSVHPAGFTGVGRRMPRLPFALRALLFYIALIVIIGKGPTYLGYPPIFLGEIVAALSVAGVLATPGAIRRLKAGPRLLTALVGLFMLIGAGITAVMVPVWGLDAVRDAAIWYYAVFFFVGTYWSTTQWAEKIWRALATFWICALLWGSANAISGDRLASLSPNIPWRDFPVLGNSGSELGQNMALGAVILLSAHLYPTARLSGWFRWGTALTGLGLFAASYGRGQKLGFATALVTAVVLGIGRGLSPRTGIRVFGLLMVAAVLGTVAALSAGIDIAKATQLDRFLEADPNREEGTHYWRMVWWRELHHAVLSKNLVFGLGFGENLSVYNPFITDLELDDHPVRSPHNINITIYARMGLLGATVWGLILVTGLARLSICVWTGWVDGARYTPKRREEILFWVMMLLTTWINSSFGVLMEGPVLGVLFWFGLGFGSARAMTTGAFVSKAYSTGLPHRTPTEGALPCAF